VAKPPKIIYEDKFFLVVDKPSGLVVNRARSVKVATLQDWLEGKFSWKEGEGDFFSRTGVVHRLDKGTSGLILVAKKPKAFFDLQSQFKRREVGKRYLALVHGRLQPGKGTIDLPLGRNPYNRKKFVVFLTGKPALTNYQTDKVFKRPQAGGSVSLLTLLPKSGRTHQLRVHLKHLNHPIVADPAYVGRKTYRLDKVWCPRIFLHAAGLTLAHPATRKKLTFSSRLPTVLKRVLKSLTPL
jgi:23S rRNA pseudouridine1911/1915/1917 synthase